MGKIICCFLERSYKHKIIGNSYSGSV